MMQEEVKELREMDETIGITGGAGFVGSQLALHLSKSFRVRILDIKPPKQLELRSTDFWECDVRDYCQVERCLSDVDVLIHAAVVQIPEINEQKRTGFEVNIDGTRNVCKALSLSKRAMGLVLTGSWHAIGEKGLVGHIDEAFGFRPDMVEERARPYAIAKIAQECIVRLYDEMSDKVFSIIRMGTVLGEGMPEKTAANTFIKNGLLGKPITPFKHSMHRPMLYIDVMDICEAYERLVRMILEGKMPEEKNSLAHVFNMCYPEPLTILELSGLVQRCILRHSKGIIRPTVEIVDTGLPSIFTEEDKNKMSIDVSKVLRFFRFDRFRSPEESIDRIVQSHIERGK